MRAESGDGTKKLIAYLAWYEDWHNVIDWGEVGKGSHPAQNPPVLEDEDQVILTWYVRHATQFSRDFCIMSGLIDSLGLMGMAKTIFFMKLNLIHEMVLRMQQEGAEKETSRG